MVPVLATINIRSSPPLGSYNAVCVPNVVFISYHFAKKMLFLYDTSGTRHEFGLESGFINLNTSATPNLMTGI